MAITNALPTHWIPLVHRMGEGAVRRVNDSDGSRKSGSGHFQLSTVHVPRLSCATIAMACTKSNGTNTSTGTKGFEASVPVRKDLTATIFRRDFQLNFEPRTSKLEFWNGPPFNDSDWFRKDDDVRWQFGVPFGLISNN